MSLEARHALVNSPNTIFQHDSQRADLLDPSKTNTNLIQLLTDLVAKNHIIEFTAIRSDHHDDSYLGKHCHAYGDAVDCWPLRSTTPGDYKDASDLAGFCHDAAIDPAEYQEGLGGSASTHANAVACGRGFFQDNGADHIHLGAQLP